MNISKFKSINSHSHTFIDSSHQDLSAKEEGKIALKNLDKAFFHGDKESIPKYHHHYSKWEEKSKNKSNPKSSGFIKKIIK